MRTILVLSLERARVRIVALALGFAVFELVVGLSYSSVDQNAIRALIDSLPPAIQALAGGVEVATPTGYTASGYLHPVALTIQAAAVISLAAAPARDAEDGVAELLLARPLAPARWLGAQALAAVAGLAVVCAGGYLGGLLAVTVVDDLAPVGAGALALALLGSLLLFASVGAVGLLVASASRSGARAIGIAGGFVVISYALDYLAQVWSLARPLGGLSVLDYYDPSRILGGGSLVGGDALVLVALTAALVAAAHVAVGRRDLTP